MSSDKLLGLPTTAGEDRPSVTGHYQGGYGDLARRVRAAGLMQRRPAAFVRHLTVLVAATAAVVALMATHRDAWWLLAMAPLMAVLATRTSFLGHDVGHLQITRNTTASRRLGLLTGNLLSGLGYGWWVPKHNAHHAHPNDLGTDPDVRPGALIWDPVQATGRRGAMAWWTRHQALLFFPLLVFEAINLHVASIRSLFSRGLRGRTSEAAMLALHFAGYTTLLVLTLTWPQAVAFVVIQKGLQGLYLGCSFAPGHKGMPVLDADTARDPLLRQVLTSRNVRGGPVTDAVLGGLNYQIEHHLFPSMPRANLRRAQPLVRAFCAEHEIPYLEYRAFASYAAGLRHLHRVGATAGEPARG